jgi:hypothetical protein
MSIKKINDGSISSSRRFQGQSRRIQIVPAGPLSKAVGFQTGIRSQDCSIWVLDPGYSCAIGSDGIDISSTWILSDFTGIEIGTRLQECLSWTADSASISCLFLYTDRSRNEPWLIFTKKTSIENNVQIIFNIQSDGPCPIRNWTLTLNQKDVGNYSR